MSYIGRGIDQIDNISTLDNLSFNGSDATFNLTQNSVAFVPVSADALQIQINGVIQSGNYTVSGSTVTFDFTPSGSSVCNGIRHYGVGLLTTVSDSSITTAKLGADSVNGSKIADDSISDEHLDITAITGQTAITSLADTDKFLVSDASDSGNLKYVEKQYLPSGAFVSVGSQSGTVDVANVVFDNVFSDTYTRYMMMVDYMLPASGNVEMRYKWRKSDSSDQSGGYTYTGLELRQGTTDEYSVSSGGATDHGVLTHNIQTGNGEHGVRALFDIYRPGTVDGNATMHYIVGRGTYRSYDADSVQAAHFYVSSNNYNTTAFTGIKVYFNSGNVNSYKIRMYGVIT